VPRRSPSTTLRAGSDKVTTQGFLTIGDAIYFVDKVFTVSPVERHSKNCVKKIRNEDVKKNLWVAAGLNFLVGVGDF